jgi:phosphatidate cytidylyltransferase
MAMRARDIGVRAASALVLAPLAVAAIWAGGVWFLALVMLACGLLAVEWSAMTAPRGRTSVAVAIAAGLLAAVIVAHMGRMAEAFMVLALGAAVAGLLARMRGHRSLDAAYGLLYLGWPAVLLVWMRDLNATQGLYWTVFVFVMAWSADIMAYLTGNLLGGPKLWPRFSPNKTWSGFWGGLAAGALAGAAMAAWLDMGLLTAVWGAALGFAAALATMAGDLWESALKRRYGVKDAGALIPGHGGLLDRVDGLMFAVVIVAAGRWGVLLMERAA